MAANQQEKEFKKKAFALNHSLKLFHSIEKYKIDDFEFKILDQLLNQHRQKSLFVRWIQIRRTCFEISKQPHKFASPLSQIFFDESLTRVLAQMIESQHFAADRFLKFREVEWDYDDVALQDLDLEFGTRFSKSQKQAYDLADRDRTEERTHTQKKISLLKAEDLDGRVGQTLLKQKGKFNIETKLDSRFEPGLKIGRVDRDLVGKMLKWSRMFFEKIQKLRVLSRSKNKQQAGYAKSDLEFNKDLFRNQSISAALLSYKLFAFFCGDR